MCDHPPATPDIAKDDPQSFLTDLRRLARALSGVKRRINNPKVPNDICYAGIAYRLPDPPRIAARILYEVLGPLPPGKTLDRINSKGDYALGNIRYATPREQTANRQSLPKQAIDDGDWEGD
jgi:hypothetical protein